MSEKSGDGGRGEGVGGYGRVGGSVGGWVGAGEGGGVAPAVGWAGGRAVGWVGQRFCLSQAPPLKQKSSPQGAEASAQPTDASALSCDGRRAATPYGSCANIIAGAHVYMHACRHVSTHTCLRLRRRTASHKRTCRHTKHNVRAMPQRGARPPDGGFSTRCDNIRAWRAEASEHGPGGRFCLVLEGAFWAQRRPSVQ